MPDRLSMHAPELVNMLGHCAGGIIFGILFYFLLVDWRRDPRQQSVLPCVAAALAFLWNAGSLVGMATAPGDPFSDTIVAASFSVLSLLPAVLLHISLGMKRPMLALSGYVVSGLAAVLHFGDLLTDVARLHYAAILLVTIGFGALAAIALAYEFAGSEQGGSGKRLAGAMALFLLAISFVHFRADHDTGGWSGEAALHHAAIPLALLLLLQDYRFLLLDAFVRFVTNALLAAVTVWAGLEMNRAYTVLYGPARDPFNIGLTFVGACTLVSLFGFVRGWTQKALTRIVFLRTSVEQTLSRLRAIAAAATDDSEFLESAAGVIRETFSAQRAEIVTIPASPLSQLRHASPVPDGLRQKVPTWVQAIAPLQFSRGDGHCLFLGARAGGRRYLSEDIELIDRLMGIVAEQVERMRNSSMQALVAQAELRALQAQINPHFFFNALNTLYGTIPRESATARRLVLNLADLFRVSFASERNSIRIEEELRLVRAYLEIEQSRLGSRLRSEVEVDDAALQTEVPVLSIQPLVENAVKHGAAARAGGGFVLLRIQARADCITVEVSNSGAFGSGRGESSGTGVGLANVRRRLALCFGEQSEVQVTSAEDMTTVSFSIPLRRALTAQVAGAS